jgi:hypothetical protein
LLVGPTAHAAAHVEHATTPSAGVAVAVVEDASCTDHASGDASEDGTQTPTPDDPQGCCQDGGCDCPCAHASAFVATMTLLAQPATELRGTGLALLPLPPDRLTRLLRPPA